jgi:hypothetical protein
MKTALLLALTVLAGPAAAVETANGSQGIVRVLDKTTGNITDLTLSPGETNQVGTLTVLMDECRYPAANPAGDAFVLIEVSDSRRTGPVFVGWLIASAPGVNAMDHPRYDVWALSCQ